MNKPICNGQRRLLLRGLGALGVMCAARPGRAEAAHCATVAVLIDDSKDSPARSPAVMKDAAGMAQDLLAAVPLGTWVYVATIVDTRRRLPLLHKTRVQAQFSPSGGIRDMVKRQVGNFLVRFPHATPEPDDAEHSRIVQGIYTASHWLDEAATTPNQVLVISDFMERSDFANFYRNCCALPAQPPFSLRNCIVHAVGIGGVGASDAKGIAVWQAWQKFLREAGAQVGQIHHHI